VLLLGLVPGLLGGLALVGLVVALLDLVRREHSVVIQDVGGWVLNEPLRVGVQSAVAQSKCGKCYGERRRRGDLI
jgi:hypothetical protein